MLKYFAALLLLVIWVPSLAQTYKVNARNDYISKIVRERTEKDKEFTESGTSPIPKEMLAGYPGLDYFPVKPRYKVNAHFEKYENPVSFRMKTTTSREPEYVIFGKATFKLNGRKLSLNVYQNVELTKKPGYEDYLFIPFKDKTNGYLTYGGGRFIDARIPKGDKIMIDFNTAYNPYCAYNHGYSCPVPPDENNLNVNIRAGEKDWKHDN